MPRTRTLGQLRGDVRSRADQVNSTFVADSEINEWINQGWTELYDMLIASGEKYYLTMAPATITGDTYTLPADHYKTLGVDFAIGGSQYANAKRFQFEQRNDYSGLNGVWSEAAPPFYDLQGGNIKFIPAPQGNTANIRHWYYPVPARMVSDSDAIDGVAGWEFYVIDWAAKKVAEKDDNFELAASLGAGLAALAARVTTMASTRNPGEAPKPRVTRGRPWAVGLPRRWWSW